MTENTDVDANPTWVHSGYQAEDRTGYSFEYRHIDTPGASPYVIVTREADGVGIGAYGSDKEADVAIANDREALAAVVKEEPSTPEVIPTADAPQPSQFLHAEI